MHENRYVLLKSDMHVRPMRFTILCTPTDSSEKTQLMFYYIALLVYILVSGAYEAGGGGRPPGLKNSEQTLFTGQAQVAQKS